ncbi:hypothetical protein RHMOL_Rhmol05G0225800 [Rhododendron molle]|uniref:Uncharacterized protein n=1 Tax=Rhododendron molle TaxID=49168 RepID=A0ACC0NS31_RHOML|nr:hypothetical protein RHMOL_Rhmol05G0225800 [Rhododendron molle]
MMIVYGCFSGVEYTDVSAYRLSLSEDTKALNQLNTQIHEGKDMASVLYTYRSCVKALPQVRLSSGFGNALQVGWIDNYLKPSEFSGIYGDVLEGIMWQLPDSMKQSQADLYLETYQVLDLEMSRLGEMQRWQGSAASKLAADMQRFSRPERRINGPTITHLWCVVSLFVISCDEITIYMVGNYQVIDLEKQRENIKPESATKDDVLGEELNAPWTLAFETYNGRPITYTDCASLSSLVAYRILREGSLLRDVKKALKEVVELTGESALPNTWCW